MINIYENEIIQLELKISSLREEIDFLTDPNENPKDSLSSYKLLIKKLNADLAEKEKTIKHFNQKKRYKN